MFVQAIYNNIFVDTELNVNNTLTSVGLFIEIY